MRAIAVKAVAFLLLILCAVRWLALAPALRAMNREKRPPLAAVTVLSWSMVAAGTEVKIGGDKGIVVEH